MAPWNSVNNNATDSTQVATSYQREFSVYCRKYCSSTDQNETLESLALIQRSISLLTTVSSQQFNPTQLETTQFFVDLHGLIDTLDGDILGACIALLQNCCKNPEVRTALLEDYRYVPLLTSVLKRTQLLTEKANRLLTLLQDLTFGIRITWEEPYIGVLLNLLIHTVYQASDEDEEKQALLALSIMINLCYKNFPVLLLFMRSVNISEFGRKIQRYGALANKMLIVLSEDLHTPDQKELHLLLRSTFASAKDCLKDWNVAHLKHIVDFLTDSRSHSGLHNAMLQYPYYSEDIERILGPLDDNPSMNDSKSEIRKQRQMCLSLIFKLILYILKLSTVSDVDGNENIISIESDVPRIFDLLCQCLDSEICGIDAVRLLDGLMHYSKGESLIARVVKDPAIITQLIHISENVETPPEHTIVILQLMLSLLEQQKTHKLILSKISESYFDKIFAPILNSMNPIISQQETEKTVFCLLLLINFANVAKKAYAEKCSKTLQLPQIQNALSRAMLNGSESVYKAVFEISQFENFPRNVIAQHMAALNSSYTRKPPESMSIVQTGPQQLVNLNKILKTHKQFASTETEERLRAVIDSITTAQRNNQINNVQITQIMELYNYKIKKYECMENDMQRRLQEASTEITKLTQYINQQNAELEKHHHLNFELQIKIESLETQSQDLKKQRENLKKNLTDLLKKSSHQSESLQISEKRLSVKVSELIALQDEMKTKKALLEKLEITCKENITKVDMLKKTVAAFETETKERKRVLEEKERELIKVNKAFDAEKEAKKKADGLIAVLETQLQEKNEELRNCERELSETEELRKTIMSLVEGKKSKRKN